MQRRLPRPAEPRSEVRGSRAVTTRHVPGPTTRNPHVPPSFRVLTINAASSPVKFSEKCVQRRQRSTSSPSQPVAAPACARPLCRTTNQIEMAQTKAHKLGIDIPLRLSVVTLDTPVMALRGTNGVLSPDGVVVVKRGEFRWSRTGVSAMSRSECFPSSSPRYTSTRPSERGPSRGSHRRGLRAPGRLRRARHTLSRAALRMRPVMLPARHDPNVAPPRHPIP